MGSAHPLVCSLNDNNIYIKTIYFYHMSYNSHRIKPIHLMNQSAVSELDRSAVIDAINTALEIAKVHGINICDFREFQTNDHAD